MEFSNPIKKCSKIFWKSKIEPKMGTKCAIFPNFPFISYVDAMILGKQYFELLFKR